MSKNSEQTDLFRAPERTRSVFGTDPEKLVRRLDPGTSVDAACAVDSEKWEEIVLNAIRSFGTSGCTSDELRGQHFTGVPYSTVTARYKALLDKKLIVDTGVRRPGNSGRPQRVMRAV